MILSGVRQKDERCTTKKSQPLPALRVAAVEENLCLCRLVFVRAETITATNCSMGNDANWKDYTEGISWTLLTRVMCGKLISTTGSESNPTLPFGRLATRVQVLIHVPLAHTSAAIFFYFRPDIVGTEKHTARLPLPSACCS